MRLEKVDVFLFTADNISVTAMAREQKRPPQSENLARLMINVQYRTAEVLLSPFFLRYGNQTKEMR